RRHTRFSRDWSSDVCSSDLYNLRRLHWNRFGLFLHYWRRWRWNWLWRIKQNNRLNPRFIRHIFFLNLAQPGNQKEQDQYWNKNRSEEHTSELQSRENLVCRL